MPSRPVLPATRFATPTPTPATLATRPATPPLPALALAAVAALATACRPAASALGTTPTAAVANAESALGALAARFGPDSLGPRFARARLLLTQSALTPSRIFDLHALWTESYDDVRLLELAGHGTPGHYTIDVDPAAPRPAAPGDYRRSMRLVRTARDIYEWSVRDELSLGAVPADRLSAALAALFSAAQSATEAAARAAYREQLPRATTAFGRLASLDTLRFTPAPGGATTVALGITLHPDRIAATFPRLARFIDHYLARSAMHVVVTDDQGARWWDASSDGDRLTLTFRVHDGSLAPLDGPPRAMPASLHLRFDGTAHAWIFQVGVRNLRGHISLTRTPHEKGFLITFRREPDWQLPPFVAAMIRTPLARPFAGAGAELGMSVYDSAGAATIADRDYDVTVEESRIVRWFGELGSSTLSDFRQGAESEMDRFVGEGLSALRLDVAILAATPSSSPRRPNAPSRNAPSRNAPSQHAPSREAPSRNAPSRK